MCEQWSFYFFFSGLGAFYLISWQSAPARKSVQCCVPGVRVGVFVLPLILQKKFPLFSPLKMILPVYFYTWPLLYESFLFFFLVCWVLSFSGKYVTFCQIFFLHSLITWCGKDSVTNNWCGFTEYPHAENKTKSNHVPDRNKLNVD